MLCFAAIFTLTNVAVKGAVTIHFFKYYVLDDGSAFFSLFDRTSLFVSSGMLALIAGVSATKLFADRFENKTLLIALSLVNSLLTAGFFFIPADQYWTMFAINIVGQLLAGPTVPLAWSMYADVADYGEWKFGRRTTALVFSASIFAQKFGLAVGAGLSGWLLSAFRFVANEVQSDTSMLGIRLLFTLFPASVMMLNVVALFFYKLSDGEVRDIENQLEAREEALAAA